MKLTIILLLFTLSAFGQADTTKVELDTFALIPAHQQMLLELLREQAEIDRLRRENQRNLEILFSAYTDPKKFREGHIRITQDFKKIIVKK